MTLITCVDSRGGLCFNKRRQSRDRAVSADILAHCSGKPLWMTAVSAKLFEDAPNICIADDCLHRAGEGEFCFLECAPDYGIDYEGVILYCWNRIYPMDTALDRDRLLCGMELCAQTEFAGNSHEKITKEVLYNGKKAQP